MVRTVLHGYTARFWGGPPQRTGVTYVYYTAASLKVSVRSTVALLRGSVASFMVGCIVEALCAETSWHTESSGTLNVSAGGSATQSCV